MTTKNWKGRPVKFTKQTFSEMVDKYIEEREFGKDKWPMTVLDFCCFADIYKDYVSEHNLWNKSKNDFSDSIKKLKTKCENSLEYWSLRWKLNTAQAIFSLKNNYGWKDKTETEISGKNGGPIEMTLADWLKQSAKIQQKEEF